MPHERLGVSIAVIQVVQHCLLQCTHRGVASAPDTSLRHFGKQSFHEIQPTTAGGSKVNVILRVARQPSSHLGHLVGSVFVHHQMNVKAAGEIGVNVVQEAQELLMPVPSVAPADIDPAGNIQSRE